MSPTVSICLKCKNHEGDDGYSLLVGQKCQLCQPQQDEEHHFRCLSSTFSLALCDATNRGSRAPDVIWQ